MNYDVPYVARKIDVYLRARLANGDETEIPFSQIQGYVNALEEIDRTPEWVVVAAIGYLTNEGIAEFKVWKRDHTDVTTVKVRISPPKSTV